MKTLPIRLIHGGAYATWAKDAGVADAGASKGGGLPRVAELARELRKVRKLVVAEMRRREPAWTEAALQRARIKKAYGMPWPLYDIFHILYSILGPLNKKYIRIFCEYRGFWGRIFEYFSNIEGV